MSRIPAHSFPLDGWITVETSRRVDSSREECTFRGTAGDQSGQHNSLRMDELIHDPRHVGKVVGIEIGHECVQPPGVEVKADQCVELLLTERYRHLVADPVSRGSKLARK